MTCTTATPLITEEVNRLALAVQDALDRGFKVLSVEPRDKGPYARYSPHAVHSATRDPNTALAPYSDNIAANYGVACGASNLIVVDVDHGIQSLEQLTDWMLKNHLPETFTVQSGRDSTDTGFHLYYSGRQATTGFSLDGVTGELKSDGGYVVGPSSRHPSGQLYRIVKDIAIVPFPAGVFPEKRPYESQGTLETPDTPEKLIPASQRNGRLTSLAGTLRNKHLSEDVIFAALEDFARRQCEDGRSLPARRR